MEFDFSPENIARIKREYRKARQNLSYADSRVSWSQKDAVEKGYRNVERLQAEADAERRVAVAAFDKVYDERESYRLRGYCR